VKQRLSVLLDDPDVLATKLRAVAKVVAKALGEPVSDASSRIRYGRGILVRDLPAIFARRIGRDLAQLGLGSFTAGGVGGLRTAPRPRRVGAIEINDEGVALKVGAKPAKTFPWDDVLAVHAHGTVPPPSSSDIGMPLPKRGPTSEASTSTRALTESLRVYESNERTPITLGIDLLVSGLKGDERVPLLYRIEYDTQGIFGKIEGRSSSLVGNYLLLLQGLLDGADEDTLVPPTTRRLLVRHECTDVLYVKREELDSFNTWILHALERGIHYGEPEDIDDDALHDEDEAVLVGDDEADAEELDDEELEDSADDLDDEDLEDSAEDEDDEEEEEDEELEDSAEDEEDEEDLAADDGESYSGERADASSDIAAAEDLDDADLELDDADLEEEEAESFMDHFNRTRRVNKAEIAAMLAEAKGLEIEDDDAGDEVPAEDVAADMGFFSSGRWDVSELDRNGE
jgi:hypothetical protein